MEHPLTLISLEELKAWRKACRASGHKVGFVPTMGALHEGHISLVKSVRSHCDQVLVSIFVNPLQFGPNEDFERYPRTFKADLELLKKNQVNAVYVPNLATIYPESFQTKVVNNQMAHILCGLSRPGHFDGVLTIVLKLFNLVGPDVVAFGKKDYQQLSLIKKMVEDLSLDIEILGCEIKREADGLAMSSRNRYLSDDERLAAVCLSQGLKAAKALFDRGEKQAEKLLSCCRGLIDHPAIKLEYLEIRSQRHLEEVGGAVNVPAVMLIAAKLGQTRLIDNLEL